MHSTASGHRRARAAGGALLATIALVVAACSSGDDSSSATTAKASASATTAAASSTSAAAATSSGSSAPGTTAAAPTTAAAEKPTYGGTLRVGVQSETANAWVPAKMSCDLPCYIKITPIFEPLGAIGEDDQVHPYLAKSIEHDAQYLTWTITARPGITFSDGTPFDAAAIVENLTRLAKSPLVGASIANIAKNADGSPAITALDAMTAQVKVQTPWPAFAHYISLQPGFMASPTWLKAADTNPDLEKHPIGTGPFLFDSYAVGDRFVVKKNPNYWRKDAGGGDFPYLDKIEFRVIQDAKARQNALESGQIDIMHTDLADSIAQLRKEADKFPMTESARLGDTTYLLLNLLDPNSPLADKNLRCALNYATDRQGVIDVTGGTGIAKVANGLFSPGQEGYLDDTGAPGFDLDQARKLVDAYKAAHGGQAPKLKLGTTNDQTNLLSAQFIQEDWKKAGIDTDIVRVEQSAYITKALLGDDDFQIFEWRQHAGSLVDEQYLWWIGSNAKPKGQLSLNFGRVKDDVVDQLLNQARSEPDAAKRKAIAEQINKRRVEQCYTVPIAWGASGVAHTTKVKGLEGAFLPDTKLRPTGASQGYFPAAAIYLAG